jgi:hypothetical protein
MTRDACAWDQRVIGVAFGGTPVVQELMHDAHRPLSSHPSSTILPVAQSRTAQVGSLRPLRCSMTFLSLHASKMASVPTIVAQRRARSAGELIQTPDAAVEIRPSGVKRNTRPSQAPNSI